MRRILASASLIVFGAGGSAGVQLGLSDPRHRRRVLGAECRLCRPKQPGGDVFCCIGSSRSTGSICAYPGGNRVGAGLAAGGAMLEVLGALLNMLGSSPSSDDDARAEAEARWRGDRADARRRAAAWNASGLAQAKLGDDVSAEAHFAAAVKFAQNAGDRMRNNSTTATCTSRGPAKTCGALARSGGRADRRGRRRMRAAAAARFTGRADLTDQIYRQRGDMLAQAAKSRRRIEPSAPAPS
ncbi:MAG: hypothetical protein U1F37_09415 [Alphaproteobacteria bacterium]